MSFRTFSRRAGLRSPNYLKLVMDGRRNLSVRTAPAFARACGLDAERAAYFVDLVAFNQARTPSERQEAYERLARHRRYREIRRLDVEQAAYHAHWWIPAIRELAARRDFQADPAWIARQLVPSIRKDQAARALDVLVRLGMLVRDETDGRWKQAEPLLTTGPETRGVHIARYHRVMLERAAHAIDLFGPDDRDVSSLTLCVGPGGLRALKERLASLRRELLEWSALEPDPEQVVQLGFQLFPLSRRRDGTPTPRRARHGRSS